MAEYNIDQIASASQNALDEYNKYEALRVQYSNQVHELEPLMAECKWKTGSGRYTGVPRAETHDATSGAKPSTGGCNNMKSDYYTKRAKWIAAEASAREWKAKSELLTRQYDEMVKQGLGKAAVAVTQETAENLDSKQMQKNVFTIIGIVIFGVIVYIIVKMFIIK